MEKVLVTGANGFIGSHILRILGNSRFKIFATDITENSETKTKIKWIKADLGDKKETENLIKTVKADYLLHLAWNLNPKMKKDEEEQNRWVDISMNLVNLFACYGGKRVISVGTCMEYDWNKPLLTEEQTTLNPQNIYGRYKNKLYQKFSTYCLKNDLSYVWGRIFYLYGPRQDKNRIVPYVMNSIAKGNEVLTSHGNQVYDYLHVEDVAQALMELIDNEFSGTVNICSGKPLKLKDLILEIANQMDGKELLRFGAIENDKHPHDYVVGSNERLKEITGWKQRISIEEGIKKTIQTLLA